MHESPFSASSSFRTETVPPELQMTALIRRENMAIEGLGGLTVNGCSTVEDEVIIQFVSKISSLEESFVVEVSS
jgi:hypothetical protein